MARLELLEVPCLAIAGGVAIAELLLWLVPVLRPFGPPGWQMMVGDTAAGIVLAALATWLSGEDWHTKNAAHWIWIPVAVLLAIFGFLVLVEYRFGVGLGIDQLIYSSTAAHVTRFPGRPAPQTALGFVLVGTNLLLVRAEIGKRASAISDAAALLLLGFVLVMCGGYLYGAAPLIGVDPSSLSASQTLGCFGLLTFVLVARRARTGGLLRILLSTGIGGRAIRVLLPLVFLVPFLIFGVVGYVVEHHILPIPFARAFAAVISALAGLFVVIWLTTRINTLEGELRAMALNDDLTGVLNRRGFDFLAEPVLHESRRYKFTVTALFFDIDGLKETNDRLGHDAGSRLITDMAHLLRSHFRKEDPVARFGGDEFVVLMRGKEWKLVLSRLRADSEALTETGKRPYRIEYSVGEAVFDPASKETLESLVARADAKMYAEKIARKSAKASGRGGGEAARLTAEEEAKSGASRTV